MTENAQLPTMLARFNSLYTLLAKQRAKQSGAGQNSAYISASNQGSKNANPTTNPLLASLPMIDRLKLIHTLAKSEAALISTSTQALDTSN